MGNCLIISDFAAREESPEFLSGSYKIACGGDRSCMNVHLIDGTYELFRHFFGVPLARDVSGQEIGAVRGVLTSVLSMIEHGATHIGVATDHVVESFRNDLYP